MVAAIFAFGAPCRRYQRSTPTLVRRTQPYQRRILYQKSLLTRRKSCVRFWVRFWHPVSDTLCQNANSAPCLQTRCGILMWSSMTYTYLKTNSVGVSTAIAALANPDLSRVTITSIFAADADSYCMASSKSGICESIAQSTDRLVTGRTSNILRSVLSLFGNSSLPTDLRKTYATVQNVKDERYPDSKCFSQ